MSDGIKKFDDEVLESLKALLDTPDGDQADPVDFCVETDDGIALEASIRRDVGRNYIVRIKTSVTKEELRSIKILEALLEYNSGAYYWVLTSDEYYALERMASIDDINDFPLIIDELANQTFRLLDALEFGQDVAAALFLHPDMNVHKAILSMS